MPTLQYEHHYQRQTNKQTVEHHLTYHISHYGSRETAFVGDGGALKECQIYHVGVISFMFHWRYTF